MRNEAKAQIQFTVTYHTNASLNLVFEPGEVEDEKLFVKQLEERIRNTLRRNLPCPGLGPEISILNPRFEYWGEKGEKGGLFTARLIVVGSSMETVSVSL